MSSTAQFGRAEEQLRTDTTVVVLNTHYSGLAIARDLGPLGVRVIGLSSIPESHGNRSRWLNYRAAADSLHEPAALLDQLARLRLEIGHRPILLPTRDHDINFILAHRSQLDRDFHIALLPAAALDAVMNKQLLAERAAGIGLSVPRSVVVRTEREIEDARALHFPCICKPVYASQWRKPGIWDAVGRQKARRVESFDKLQRFYGAFSKLDPLVHVQEWIEGSEEDLLIFGSYRSVKPIPTVWFTARKRLQYPPLAGTGIVVEAQPLPEVVEPAMKLLSAIDFAGISELEFKRDRRTGALFLIELNPRHWDQHGLGTKVGVNLSESLYRDMTQQAPRAMIQGDRAVLWIAEAEYARHALRALTGRAPLADLRLALHGHRTWSWADRHDPGPLKSLLGMR